jgi:hypothetical protein
VVDVDDDSTCTLVDLVNDMPSYGALAAIAGAISSNLTVGKCSVLHSQPCALNDWDDAWACAASAKAWFATLSSGSVVAADWATLGAEVTTKLGKEGCTVNTSIGYGPAGCGSDATSATDVCWVLAVSTTTALHDTSCKGAAERPRCAKSVIKAIVFESRTLEGAVSCDAEPDISAPSTDSTTAFDLDEAFSLTDLTLCGGDIYRPGK